MTNESTEVTHDDPGLLGKAGDIFGTPGSIVNMFRTSSDSDVDRTARKYKDGA